MADLNYESIQFGIDSSHFSDQKLVKVGEEMNNMVA